VREGRSLSKRERLIIAVCLTLLLGSIMWMGIGLVRLWKATSTIRADLDALESLAASEVQALDLDQAIRLLHTTRTDLETLQATARPFLRLAPYLGWLPHYGPDIQAAPMLLEIALNLTAAGEVVVKPLLPLLNQATGQEKPEQKELFKEALVILQAAQPQLRSALSSVQNAQAARKRLQAGRLSPRVQEWVKQLDRYLPLLELGAKGTLYLPRLLGVDNLCTYLVLIQNEDELRPTGGFISGVARVTIEKGSIIELEDEDSDAVDDFSRPYPEPPAPLLEYMLSEIWLFRDSNWSPDFPTSATAAIDLYTISRDVQIDGVLALDQQAIRLLIEALGPLQVEGYNEPVTGQNVVHMARQAWNPGDEVSGEWWVRRKDFMSLVLAEAIHQLESGLDRTALARLTSATRRALDEKHLLVYVKDKEAAALMAEPGWDGAMLSGQRDYLMVVDANMGFNKANALVEESLEYAVDLTDLEHPRATLTVRHAHLSKQGNVLCRHEPRYDPSYQQMMERCYWNYLRVYVPLEAQLVDATPHTVSGLELLSGRPSSAQVTVGPPEQGHNVFGTFFLLRRGEALETRFEYALPTDVFQVQDGGTEYVLTVQKQPGTQAIPLQVRIVLPPGIKVGASEPEPTLATTSELEYALTLERDQVVRVILCPAICLLSPSTVASIAEF
jgi:hypothetical protein